MPRRASTAGGGSSGPDDPFDGLLARLKAGRKRLTPQRLTILRAIVGTSDHLDIDAIRARAEALGAPVSPATVYRTVRLLVDEGLIKERHFKDGVARYEYVEEGDHHDHLICTGCGSVMEFKHDTIEHLQEVVADQHGFLMTGHKHEIYGLCAACRRT